MTIIPTLSAQLENEKEGYLLKVVLAHRLVSSIPAQTLEAGVRKVLTWIEILRVPLP
jgi:hypothetical protein